MRSIVFTPKWENGKPAVRKAIKGDWFYNGGLFIHWIADMPTANEFPIYTRSEVEIPDPEPIGWVFRKTGEVGKAVDGEWIVMQGKPHRWDIPATSSKEYSILSCTPIYQGDK